MNNISDNTRKKIDIVTKVALIIIIILLLLHNCTLMKENKSDPNGNVDIIEIDCDNNQCSSISSLSFAQRSISVKEGNKQKLVVIVKPSSLASSKFKWKSSDESIATVNDDGVVTGLKEGQVTITVTSSNGISATCIVNVVAETVNVNKIVLNPNNISLKVGDTDQIVSKVEPENATERDLVWSSSDSSIVTVDENGVIKGLKPGTATITVKTKDGKVSSTCKITVEAIKVSEIVLNLNEMPLKVGKSGQLVATVKPDNATDKEVIWTTSDSSIATVDENGKVTGIKEGTVTIAAKTKDGKISATCTVIVTTDTVPVNKIILSMDYDAMTEYAHSLELNK